MTDGRLAILRTLIPLVLLSAACGARESATSRKPVVVLISIDTLRSDHLPAYGARHVSTPNIARLAADGIVFEHAFSHVPLTLPSHAALMTGQLPPENGVRDNAGYRLAPDAPTIASRLREHGYATGAAVSAWVLRGETNLSSGFDFYDDRISWVEGAPTGDLQRPGGETAAAIMKWIGGHSHGPLFAFVHFFEPHAPYEPTYDAEIEKSDALVGQVLDQLQSLGLYDNAMIVLLSDHGEGLGDHGEAEHGILLYREALQVPLIVKLPANQRRGERVSRAVQLIDVLPTIAEVVGLPPPSLSGTSLLGRTESPRPIYGETLYPRLHLGWSDLRSVVRYPFHLIDGPRPELYDLDTDVAERRDLRESDRRSYSDLRAELATFPAQQTNAPAITSEERRKLAALGYVGAQAAATSSNINPRDHLADLAALKDVTELMSSRRFAAAAPKIEALLKRNPGWSDLRDDLGLCYLALGDRVRAEKTYRDAIRVTPELGGMFALSLADILLEGGKLDEAESHARLGMDSNPSGAHERLARIAVARNDFASAMREADAMGRSAPLELQADFLKAQILDASGDREGAAALLTKVHEQSRARKAPLPSRYWFVTGEVYARMGRSAEAQASFERAIAIHPEDREAWEGLAAVQRMEGDEKGAQRTLSRAPR